MYQQVSLHFLTKTLFNYQIIDHLVSVCIRYDEMIKTKPKHTTTITATVMTIFYVRVKMVIFFLVKKIQ
jgi:hypothetical protein